MSRLSQHQTLELMAGIEQFNSGEFYQCHETLEKLWLHYPTPDREVIQGIIQIAVGYYHLSRANQAGGLKLLKRGVQRLQKFAPAHFGIDLDSFIAKVSKEITRTEAHAEPPSC